MEGAITQNKTEADHIFQKEKAKQTNLPAASLQKPEQEYEGGENRPDRQIVTALSKVYSANKNTYSHIFVTKFTDSSHQTPSVTSIPSQMRKTPSMPIP